MLDPPVGGTIWEELGSVALLVEVCHWGWALSFQILTTHSTPSYITLPPAYGLRQEFSATVPDAMFPNMMAMGFSLSTAVSPKLNDSFYKLPYTLEK